MTSSDVLAADDTSIFSEDTFRVNNLKSTSSFDSASYSYDDIRAQLDTGAKVTCTNVLHILHNFKYYDSTFPSSFRLTVAIDKSFAVLRLGEGYLNITAINRQGFIAGKCLYSPHLTSSLLSENDIILTSGDSEKDFSDQIIDKTFTESRSTGNFTLTCHHKLRRRQDILIHGQANATRILCFFSICPSTIPSLTFTLPVLWLLVMIPSSPKT